MADHEKGFGAAQLEMLQLLSRAPMAMEPRALQALFGSIRANSAGLFDDLMGRPDRERPTVPPGVALIPVSGPLMHRSLAENGGLMSRIFGLRTYTNLWQSIEEALNDDGIQHVVLDVNSPGGAVSGLFEITDAIYNARGRKPMTALVDEQATSAAYTIASAADRVLIPRSGTAGSLGVLAMHVDESALNERIGLDFSYITSGARKADGNPDEPLSEKARADLQAEVNRLAGILFETVARNRGVDVEKLRGQEAAVFHGQQAIDAGLADRVQSVQEALQEAAPPRRRNARAQSWNRLVDNRLHKNNDQHSKDSDAREQTMSNHLSTELGKAIQAATTDEKPREKLVGELAEAAQIGPKTMEAVIGGEIAGPPDEVLASWAGLLEVDEKTLKDAAASDRQATGEQPAAAEPKGGTKVVDFDSARARSQGISYATEVTQLCSIAGRPDLAAEFLQSEAPLASVRSRLMEARANEGPGEIDGRTAGDDADDKNATEMWGRVHERLGARRKEGGEHG